MSTTPDPTFAVGERYENRRGLFEVLSICRDEMVIRWDTGEQTTTPIELQARILRNMKRDLSEGATKKGFRLPKSYGEIFTGLSAGDFSDDVTGTHWRSREQLGGAVTRGLAVEEPFESWSIYKRPEVHWASVGRYGLMHPSLQTKFFLRMNNGEMPYGLYIERSDTREDNQDDWLSFLKWCRNPDHCRRLHKILKETGAVFTNPHPSYDQLAYHGEVSASDDGVFHYTGRKEARFAAEELASFLEALPTDLWLNLSIARTLSASDAIAQGSRVASVIADLFNALMPVYATKSPVTVGK